LGRAKMSWLRGGEQAVRAEESVCLEAVVFACRTALVDFCSVLRT
jgi:hypothetical protein